MRDSWWFSTLTHPWLITLGALAIAVVAALVAHWILLKIARRLASINTIPGTLVEFTGRPGSAVLPLLAVQFVLTAAPDDLPFASAARTATALMLIAAMTWLAMRAVAAVGEAVVRLNPATAADNLQARRIQTQTRVLSRVATFFVLLIGVGSGLMMFPNVQQIGTSLLASAGVAGLVAGIAARPVLGNLIAGLQIAITQPIRLDDVVIIENEWGRIEEITATYVVVKIWDERRLVVPLQWVIEHPFQNWTRTQAQLLGTVFLWLDYRVPLAPLRAELERVCRQSPEWDGRVALIQVVDSNDRAIQVRALVSAADAPSAWDLRCRVREALIDYLQREHPDALPRLRAEMDDVNAHPPSTVPAPPPLRAGKGDSLAIKEPMHPELIPADPAQAAGGVASPGGRSG